MVPAAGSPGLPALSPRKNRRQVLAMCILVIRIGRFQNQRIEARQHNVNRFLIVRISSVFLSVSAAVGTT